MSALNDGRCAKCDRRMGWAGKAQDKPACSYCGHIPTQKERDELTADEKLMEDMTAELLRD
jgi:DNA-directed RNA polymerase subunit RPC12/RpoP